MTSADSLCQVIQNLSLYKALEEENPAYHEVLRRATHQEKVALRAKLETLPDE